MPRAASKRRSRPAAMPCGPRCQCRFLKAAEITAAGGQTAENTSIANAGGWRGNNLRAAAPAPVLSSTGSRRSAPDRRCKGRWPGGRCLQRRKSACTPAGCAKKRPSTKLGRSPTGRYEGGRCRRLHVDHLGLRDCPFKGIKDNCVSMLLCGFCMAGAAVPGQAGRALAGRCTAAGTGRAGGRRAYSLPSAFICLRCSMISDCTKSRKAPTRCEWRSSSG